MSRHGQSTVVWWVGWITLTIVTFFISCYLWTGLIARFAGPMQKSGVPVLWITAVFGTWMIFLVPLIVVMYNKVDRVYEDARERRETEAFERAKQFVTYKTCDVDLEKRTLRPELIAKVRKTPRILKNGHLMKAILKNGRSVEHLFVYNEKELLGVYGMEKLDFEAGDIQDLEPMDLDKLPEYQEQRWLRFDGVIK